MKYFVKFADKVTCVSLNEKRLLKKIWRIEADYIPNGIKNYENNHLKINEVSNEKLPYITFAAGRIIELKGLDILLKAIKSINNAPLLKIIGDLNHEKEYRIIIEELANGLNVEFVGLIKEKRILYQIIADSCFFIFPSRQEAMSMMLLEVAALRIPIIASDIIENKDVFNENEVLYFQNENTDSLRNKIIWALENKNKMKEHSEKAYQKLINEYSWNNISKKYAEIYNKYI